VVVYLGVFKEKNFSYTSSVPRGDGTMGVLASIIVLWKWNGLQCLGTLFHANVLPELVVS
jgi:hypothetical protein